MPLTDRLRRLVGVPARTAEPAPPPSPTPGARPVARPAAPPVPPVVLFRDGDGRPQLGVLAEDAGGVAVIATPRVHLADPRRGTPQWLSVDHHEIASGDYRILDDPPPVAALTARIAAVPVSPEQRPWAESVLAAFASLNARLRLLVDERDAAETLNTLGGSARFTTDAQGRLCGADEVRLVRARPGVALPGA